MLFDEVALLLPLLDRGLQGPGRLLQGPRGAHQLVTGLGQPLARLLQFFLCGLKQIGYLQVLRSSITYIHIQQV